MVMDSPPSRERSRRADPRKALLAWFNENGPDYPWRKAEDDPYAVLVSEVMLQQTQAGRVEEIFPVFMTRFPSVTSLADASPAEVLRAWAGLGYHRRAVSLHEAARAIVSRHAGSVPRGLPELLALPGVGPYTAAAVASIAYGVPVAAVDTNARKVMARLDHGVERDEIIGREAEASAAGWLAREHPGDWNQAVMNLGRAVCRTTPRCDECPLASACRFRAAGRQGRPSVRRQAAFEGSVRQVRGAVVSQLRAHPFLTISRLASLTGYGSERVTEAVAGLHRDRVVTATDGALSGHKAGRVRLPR
jgi:A/G-specific adenine glycosylase